ncbi:hypothetical protein FRB93_002819 [Tulasnella sp. JGI-2019a]|nr:hypothetical protein FRB93_002819 [Tulasnella sp. JGI-2019a]
MPKEVDPIVIPPLVVQDKFTCIGAGLLYDGHARETPEVLRMLLLPNGTGTAITDRSRPKSWWIGQAIFYEIPCNPKTATVTAIRAQLESAIRSKALQLPSKIRTLETKSNREFKQLNKEVLEKTGAKSKTTATATAPAAKKAVTAVTKAETKKAVKAPAAPAAAKPPAASKPTAKKSEKPPIAAKAETMAKGKRKAADAFDADGDVEMKNPEAPEKRKKQTAKKSANTHPAFGDVDDRYGSGPATHSPISSPSRRARPAASSSSSEVAAGSWAISCPYIQDQWPESAGRTGDDSPFSLNVVRTHGNMQIEADFHFGILYGFIRSKQPVEGRPGGGAYVTFEWVGREQEGPVVTPSNQQSGFIKFSIDANTGQPILKGKMNSVPGAGDVEFQGEWTDPPRQNNYRWDDFDEAAYEEARVSRWR